MNKTSQLLCAHTGWLVLILMGLSLFNIAGWFPLIPPSLVGDDLARMFDHDRTRIRIAMLVLQLSGVFWWSFSAAISTQMRRIEGALVPVMSQTQLSAATGTAMIIMLPAIFWLVAAYRPDAKPEIVQAFNDLAWIGFIGFYAPIVLQTLSVAVCILTDEGGNKVYPRWLGFANLWAAILFLPGALVPLFHDGPFAWNGLIAFWMVGVVFASWIITMWWMTVKAIRRQAAEVGR